MRSGIPLKVRDGTKKQTKIPFLVYIGKCNKNNKKESEDDEGFCGFMERAPIQGFAIEIRDTRRRRR